MQIQNIIFTGVGGQGIILASRILAQCAFQEGFDVKENELHGMAQREGSVISHVRFGEKVYSPLVARGKADYLVALEELEGLRYLAYLKPGGVVILNKRKKKPANLNPNQTPYPEDVKAQIEAKGFQADEIDAVEIARKVGSPKIENIVLLGDLSRYMPFSNDTWKMVIEKSVPPKFIEMNLKAFEIGKSIYAEIK